MPLEMTGVRFCPRDITARSVNTKGMPLLDNQEREDATKERFFEIGRLFFKVMSIVQKGPPIGKQHDKTMSAKKNIAR